jgi:FMN phosphatase YigB (HAD superfamily)
VLKAILFDLDNTLLENDMGVHIPSFLELLAPRFGHLIPPEVFKRWMLRSVRQMIVDIDERCTNRDVFCRDLVMRSGYSWAVLGPLFEGFYAQDYAQLEPLTRAIALAPRVVEEALERGLTVALATNPIFPREAMLERLRWAGLDGLPFALITSYEEAHFCKPHPEYFQEVAARLELEPQDCLMAGDDLANDLPAVEAGVRTYLVTDHTDRRKRACFEPTLSGTLEDLLQLLKSPRRLADL